MPGDGNGKQGNCEASQFCYANMNCSTLCSKAAIDGAPGDGTDKTQGNCATDEFCFSDGMCIGIVDF